MKNDDRRKTKVIPKFEKAWRKQYRQAFCIF